MINYRFVCIALFLFCLASLLPAQDEDIRFTHRFAWGEVSYAFRYEVLIEQELEGTYTNVFLGSTDRSYIFASLPPGNFRVRVIPFDFFDLPGEELPWRYFRIAAPAVGEEPEEYIVLVRNRRMFLGLVAYALGYSPYNTAFGGGITFGGDFNRIGIGMSLLYTQDAENFIFMEAIALFRWYMLPARNSTGLFLQANGGIAFFAYDQPGISDLFAPSAGLSLGWRFPLSRRWYIEPSIRGGFPYMFGASLTIGLR